MPDGFTVTEIFLYRSLKQVGAVVVSQYHVNNAACVNLQLLPCTSLTAGAEIEAKDAARMTGTVAPSRGYLASTDSCHTAGAAVLS